MLTKRSGKRKERSAKGWLYATENGLVVPIIPFLSLAPSISRLSLVGSADLQIATLFHYGILFPGSLHYNSSCLLDPSLPDPGSSVCSGTCVLLLLLGRTRGGFF